MFFQAFQRAVKRAAGALGKEAQVAATAALHAETDEVLRSRTAALSELLAQVRLQHVPAGVPVPAGAALPAWAPAAAHDGTHAQAVDAVLAAAPAGAATDGSLAAALSPIVARMAADLQAREAEASRRSQLASQGLNQALLHHLERARDVYQDTLTKLTQGPLPKFRP